MTFKETAIQSMFERGMFREDAEQAFEILKADPTNKAMTTRWNEDVGNYSSAVWLPMAHGYVRPGWAARIRR